MQAVPLFRRPVVLIIKPRGDSRWVLLGMSRDALRAVGATVSGLLRRLCFPAVPGIAYGG
jgi:hypothetical protein